MERVPSLHVLQPLGDGDGFRRIGVDCDRPTTKRVALSTNDNYKQPARSLPLSRE